jgi:hypothetical protein
MCGWRELIGRSRSEERTASERREKDERCGLTISSLIWREGGRRGGKDADAMHDWRACQRRAAVWGARTAERALSWRLEAGLWAGWEGEALAKRYGPGRLAGFRRYDHHRLDIRVNSSGQSRISASTAAALDAGVDTWKEGRQDNDSGHSLGMILLNWASLDRPG